MSPHAASSEGLGPARRVAICRRRGQLARVTAVDVAAQLREAGCMVIHLDEARTGVEEPALEWMSGAGYDVVVAIGECRATALPIAVTLDIPLVEAAVPTPRDVGSVIARCLDTGGLIAARLIEVRLPDTAVVAMSPVVLRASVGGSFALHTPTGVREVSGEGAPLEISVTATGLEVDGEAVHRVDGISEDLALDILCDGRTYRASRLSVVPHPHVLLHHNIASGR